MKIAVLIKIAYFRLSTSAKNPEYSVPNQAPSSKIEVSQPFFVEFVVYSPMWLPNAVMVKTPITNERKIHTIYMGV